MELDRVTRAILILCSVALLSACDQQQVKFEQRKAYWQNALEQGVPTGTSKDQAIIWGNEHLIRFDYLEHQHKLYANVEKVAVDGIPFPCSQWNVILAITIDDKGLTTKNEVTGVGDCL